MDVKQQHNNNNNKGKGKAPRAFNRSNTVYHLDPSHLMNLEF